MTEKQFSEAMAALDDRYISEAAKYPTKKKHSRAVRWLSVAACLVLVAALGIVILQGGELFGDTVELQNGEVLRFANVDSVGIASIDADVTVQKLSQAQVQQLFPDMQAHADAIFAAADDRLLGIEGQVGKIKLIVSCSDVPLLDTVLLGEETTSTVNGVPVTAGRFVTDKNSRGERTAIYYAAFQLGESTFYIENAGDYGAREAVKTELADILQTILKNGEPNWETLKEAS